MDSSLAISVKIIGCRLFRFNVIKMINSGIFWKETTSAASWSCVLWLFLTHRTEMFLSTSDFSALLLNILSYPPRNTQAQCPGINPYPAVHACAHADMHSFWCFTALTESFLCVLWFSSFFHSLKHLGHVVLPTCLFSFCYITKIIKTHFPSKLGSWTVSPFFIEHGTVVSETEAEIWILSVVGLVHHSHWISNHANEMIKRTSSSLNLEMRFTVQARDGQVWVIFVEEGMWHTGVRLSLALGTSIAQCIFASVASFKYSDVLRE